MDRHSGKLHNTYHGICANPSEIFIPERLHVETGLTMHEIVTRSAANGLKVVLQVLRSQDLINPNLICLKH